MTDQELKDLVASLAESQKKTDEQMAETERTVSRIAKMVGGISNNQGDVAEEFFYNSLARTRRLGNMEFDLILQNMLGFNGRLRDEFDIVLINGENVVVIETKYKVHPNDIDKVRQKIPNLKTFFPQYGDLNVYGGVAGFYIPEEAVAKAKEAGFFVLKRAGDVIEVETGELKAG